MHIRSFLCLLFVSAVAVSAAFSQSMTVENPDPGAEVSEEKPAYLFFKNAVISKKGKFSYDVDVTLWGEIPSNMADKIYYYLGLDIDNDKSTGDVSTVTPTFGKDIAVWIEKPKGTNKFDAHSGTMHYRNVKESISVTGVKVSGDTISFKMRSQLFGLSDTFKFFFSATRIQLDGDRVLSDVQVDTLPRKGVATFHGEK
ncbi:MAG TPA: hypothetical protein PLS03_01335 [Terrimicrobiaceae bacterium]|nr:hypothetical protein [Terrimicrobiaceae bacterium]